MHAGSRVDAVVVNFNAARDLSACLRSLLDEPVDRIIVVDNASTDDSQSVVAAVAVALSGIDVSGSVVSGSVVSGNAVSGNAVSGGDEDSTGRISWLPTGANLGFGSGANRGFAATANPYVLLLNPDAVVVAGAVAAMCEVLDAEPETGVVGPEVVNMDGTRYPSARAFPNMVDAIGHGALGLVVPGNRWSARYRSPDQIDWVSGTAMLLRRTALERIGGFDESYFMYVEDVDLCWRLRAAGWKVRYLPTATVRHRIGGSSEQRPYRMIVSHHRSLWRFARSTTTGLSRLALPVVALGLVTRSVVASISRFVRKRPPAAQ